MTTPRAQIKQIQVPQFGSLNDFAAGADGNFAVTPTEVAKLHRRVYTAHLTDANTANVAMVEFGLFRAANGPVRVISADVTTPVGIDVTADDTDYASVVLSKRTAGGAATVVGTKSTTVAGLGLTALTPAPVTLVAAAVDLALNDVLTVQLTKTGAGQKVSASTGRCLVTVTVEEM